MAGETVQLRRPTDNYRVERVATDLVDVLLGNRGGMIRLRGYSGESVSRSGGTAGTVTSSGGYALDVQSVSGFHAAFVHSGTAADAAPTPANSVLLITDTGVATGFGKSIRVYETAGTDYTEVTSADGLFSVGGSGANAGIVSALKYRVREASGTDYSELSSADALLSIGGSGANAGMVALGTTPATVGTIRIPNNVGAYARNAGNTADINLIGANGSNQVIVGDGTNAPLTALVSSTDARLVIGSTAILTALSTGVTISPSLLQIGTNPASVGFIRLPNNNGVYFRNAANGGDVHAIGVNSSDVIGVGQTGNTMNLLGTVVAPSIDPPTVDGQLTNGSLVRAYASVTVSGGAVTLRHNYNIASVTYNAAGDYSIAWDKDFVNGFYACLVTVEDTALLVPQINASKASTGADIHIRTAAGVKTDPAAFHVLAIGAF